jgi:methionyl-tRNA synthetase
LESDKDNPERVQTQMYALQIAAFEFTLRTILTFTAKKLSRILKIESPLNWNTIAQNLI